MNNEPTLEWSDWRQVEDLQVASATETIHGVTYSFRLYRLWNDHYEAVIRRVPDPSAPVAFRFVPLSHAQFLSEADARTYCHQWAMHQRENA